MNSKAYHHAIQDIPMIYQLKWKYGSFSFIITITNEPNRFPKSDITLTCEKWRCKWMYELNVKPHHYEIGFWCKLGKFWLKILVDEAVCDVKHPSRITLVLQIRFSEDVCLYEKSHIMHLKVYNQIISPNMSTILLQKAVQLDEFAGEGLTMRSSWVGLLTTLYRNISNAASSI